MMKLILVGFIWFQAISSYAQFNTDKISAELRYPIPRGNNFINSGIGNGYIGLVDFGLDYNVIETNGLGVGLLLNSSILIQPVTDLTLSILSPKIKMEYAFDVGKFSLIPQIGFGYSYWQFIAPANMTISAFSSPLGRDGFSSNRVGWTIIGGTKFVFNSRRSFKWFAKFDYEFTKLELSDTWVMDIKYNRELHLLYPGVGLIWNFNWE